MFDYSEVVAISSFAGERFDLVQAGGGNSSAKLSDGNIYVKSSGIMLGDAKGEGDFCCLEWRPLVEFVSSVETVTDTKALEERANALVAAAAKSGAVKPSIETLLHCLLGPLTLHTHPIAVNILACRQNWKDILGDLFPQAFLIDYATPGAPLAVSLSRAIQKGNWKNGDPATIFLQNHGLIVAAGSASEVIERTENVVELIANNCSLDLSRYRLTNFASSLLKEATRQRWVAHLCENSILADQLERNPNLFFALPALPDQLVYCGAGCVEVDADAHSESLKKVHEFIKRNGTPPRVMIVCQRDHKYLVILAQAIRKCREIEDVLASHIMILNASQSSPVQFLAESEMSYLSNWDAEKYRQTI